MAAVAGLRDGWVRLALIAALLLPLYFIGAALATKFGLIDWRIGFGLLTLRLGPQVVIGVLGFAVAALGLSMLIPPRRGRRIALAAVALAGAALGAGMMATRSAQGAPPIHDVTTNLEDPPAFSVAVAAARAAVPGGNGLDLAGVRVPDAPRFGPAAGRAVIDLHREAYADLRTLSLAIPADVAFARARAAADAEGWRITRAAPEAGAIEAEVESFWFGFVDDIAVRVRPAGAGAEIDVRSVSRVGVSDLGANAARIRRFLARLEGEE